MLQQDESDIENALIQNNRTLCDTITPLSWFLFIVSLSFGIIVGFIIGIFCK